MNVFYKGQHVKILKCRNDKWIGATAEVKAIESEGLTIRADIVGQGVRYTFNNDWLEPLAPDTEAEVAEPENSQPQTDEPQVAEKEVEKPQADPKAEHEAALAALKESYTWEKCPITIGIQMLAPGDENGDRMVCIGVRNHNDLPILEFTRLSQLGDLPQPIVALLEQLRSQLEDRHAGAELKLMAKHRKETERQQRTTRSGKASSPQPKSTPPKSTKVAKSGKGKPVEDQKDERQMDIFSMFDGGNNQ